MTPLQLAAATAVGIGVGWITIAVVGAMVQAWRTDRACAAFPDLDAVDPAGHVRVVEVSS